MDDRLPKGPRFLRGLFFAEPGSREEVESGTRFTPRFNADGLIGCIACDAATGDVLTYVAGLFVHLVLVSYPVTADLGAWYAGGGTFAVAVAAATALVGFWLAMRGRTLLPQPGS